MVSLNNKTGIDENQATNLENKGEDEVEISGFFNNSVVSCFFSASCRVREHACAVLLKTDTSEGT